MRTRFLDVLAAVRCWLAKPLIADDLHPEESDPDPEMAADIEEAVAVCRQRRDRAEDWITRAWALGVPWWQMVGPVGRN